MERTDQLVETIKAAFVQGGVHLIEVPLDYSENEGVGGPVSE